MQEKKPRTTTVSSRYPLGEAASRFEGSERDVVSAGDLLRKAHPILSRNYGMQFLFRIEEGAPPAVDAGSVPSCVELC